jgi:hypothetical protein
MTAKKEKKPVVRGLSRGCPRCGSHNTDALRVRSGKLGAMWCRTCENRWLPCETPYCKGFAIEMHGPDGYPLINGCRGCGVPDHIARRWPEAYRAVYRMLLEDTDKLAAVIPG